MKNTTLTLTYLNLFWKKAQGTLTSENKWVETSPPMLILRLRITEEDGYHFKTSDYMVDIYSVVKNTLHWVKMSQNRLKLLKRLEYTLLQVERIREDKPDNTKIMDYYKFSQYFKTNIVDMLTVVSK